LGDTHNNENLPFLFGEDKRESNSKRPKVSQTGIIVTRRRIVQMGRKFEKLNKQHSQCSMNSGQFLVLQKQGDYSKVSNFRPFTLQRELG
jgi:hypothetical protein